jgi:hypothetical protein
MLGYVLGAMPGARICNPGHTYATVSIVGSVGFMARAPRLILVRRIWLAQIGFDRLLGYGLKYGTAFKDTHLGRV